MQPFATRIADVFIEHVGRNDQQREGRQSISRRVDWLESEVSEHRGFTSEPGYFRHSRFSRTISCLSGRLFVALVDVRADSPTFSHWQSFEFSGHDHRRLQFPAGVACGWQVLSPTSRFRLGYAEEPEGGDQRWLRWNDFLLQIPWPEIPDELAARPRPSMSLSSLHAHQLPLRQTPKPLPAIARQCKNRHRRRSIPLRSFTIAEAPTEPLSQHAVRAVCAVRNATEAEVPTSRILLLGCNGQLGYDLHMQLRPI